MELRQLAEDGVADASALLDAGRWSAAYYLVGYAVECALKACIAKQTREHDFPDRDFVREAYSHDLWKLINLTELRTELKRTSDPKPNPALSLNWDVVVLWSEKARYRQIDEIEARQLFQAVTDPSKGILPWIQTCW